MLEAVGGCFKPGIHHPDELPIPRLTGLLLPAQLEWRFEYIYALFNHRAHLVYVGIHRDPAAPLACALRNIDA
ncbi:MAG: hypothetical protein H0W04_00730 [Chthoniobacterales bacterium]|nr:hypothetical protein [Chthoniobacterales bacterium]